MPVDTSRLRRISLCALVTAVVLGAIIGCSLHTTADHGPRPAFTDPDDAIRLAVFRYQFDHNASGQKTAAGVYCLSLTLARKPADPSDELMAQFKDHTPPVRKRSACDSSMEGVYERETKRRGLMFHIGDITRVSETEAVVSGGYYEGGLSSSGNSYKLEKRGDEWTVTADEMDWIS